MDPTRDKLISTTDAEKSEALEIVHAIRDYLRGCGWPDPIIGDSGNGHNGLFRIDLPGDDGGLVKRCLESLSVRFNGPRATLDTSVFNAARIWKLPGTWAKKGDSTPTRPHRRAKLLEVPECVQPVPLDLLEALAAEAATPTKTTVAVTSTPPKKTERTVRGDDGRVHDRKLNVPAWLDARGVNFREKSKDGDWSRWTLEKCPFDPAHAAPDSCIFQHEDGTMGAKCLHDSCKGRGWQEFKTSIGLPDREHWVKKTESPVLIPPTTAPAAPAGKIIIRGCDIIPTKVEPLWKGRIPLGKLTTFAGQTGQGKTMATCDMIARVTTGTDWPDGKPGVKGQVLFITGDDDYDDTIVPRLIEAGADLSRVCFLVEAEQDKWTMAALNTLNTAIEQIGEDGGPVKLVVIDPPSSFMDGVDDNNNSAVRAILTPLQRWAKRHRLAVILITHVNKGNGTGSVKAVARVMGSVAWVSTPRSAFMFTDDPDDESRRLFVCLKPNLGPMPKAMAYRVIGGEDKTGRVEWLGEVDTTADEAMASGPKSPKRAETAGEWLVKIFRTKTEWTSKEFWTAAKEAGVSKDAILEARPKLGIPKAKPGVTDGKKSWVWWVPSGWTPPAAV